MSTPPRAARLVARAKPLLPWLSLATGAASALLMERSPERAGYVVAAALGAWFLVALGAVVGSLDAERLPEVYQRAVRWGLASAVIASQSLVQLCLFFSLPFYVRAASLTVGHGVFFAALLLVIGLVSWDPAFRWVFEHRWASLAVLAFGSFVGLSCVLPVLGLQNRASLVVAALLTSLGVPALERLRRRRGEPVDWRLWAKEASVALAFPALAVFGASLVPPAPLSLASGAMGTRIEDKAVADPSETLSGRPPQLVCATAIRAPRGLDDALLHEWRHDGRVLDRIPLKVRGGRQAGFRTWSIKRNLGADPAGEWACRVITEAGQVVGEVELTISGG